MRSTLAAAAAMLFALSASAAGPFQHFQPDYTFSNGKLFASKTPRGETRYEYKDGRLSRKILPKGGTIDYYYDRVGKPVEVRFSNGLVRTYQYNRAGKLQQIIGSNGFNKIFIDPSGVNVLLITGPGNYRLDLTTIAKRVRGAHAGAMMTLRPRALAEKLEDGSSDCTSNFYETSSACESGGDHTGDAYGGGGDAWGGGDYWGGDVGGGEYGDDTGYASEDDDAGYWPDNGPDSGGADPPDHGSRGDNKYLLCMSGVCEPANKNFRKWCADAVPYDYPKCLDATAKEYFRCERQCRYESY